MSDFKIERPVPRAISIARVAVGLLLAPLIPNGLSGFFLYGLALGMLWSPFSGFIWDYLLLTELWAFGIGLIVFLLLPKDVRNTLRGSLLLGAVGAFLFPAAWTLYRYGISAASVDMAIASVVCGMVALPFGLLGGSIFWFIAIRGNERLSALAG